MRLNPTPIPNMNPQAKSFIKSKTVWLQVVTFASVLLPPVRGFLAANPVEAVTVITAANTILRFATKGKITLFDD